MESIDLKDFKKVDIRIGTVVKADVPEWSHWVMRLVIDFGEGVGEKLCFSGIMKFYKPCDLIGRQFPFVINLCPKRVGPEGEVSECMMLMVVPSDDENIAPILLSPEEKVSNGTRVY